MIVHHLPLLTQKQFVLASASPRRRELLTQLGLPFRVIVSDFAEDLPHHRFESAADYARTTAEHKAEDVARKVAAEGLHADVIISADTVVEFEDEILEKPADAEDAVRVLSRLSGSRHHVHTGVALVLPRAKGASPRLHSFSETTTVEFDVLPEATIRAYVATGEPFGKAGSYGIQQTAGSFVRGIEGCYFNVMGLPVHRLSRALVQLINEGALQQEAATGDTA